MFYLTNRLQGYSKTGIRHVHAYINAKITFPSKGAISYQLNEVHNRFHPNNPLPKKLNAQLSSAFEKLTLPPTVIQPLISRTIAYYNQNASDPVNVVKTNAMATHAMFCAVNTICTKKNLYGPAYPETT